MKYTLPLTLFTIFAGPALAHPGGHFHAQDATPLIMGLALLTIVAAGGVALRVRQ